MVNYPFILGKQWLINVGEQAKNKDGFVFVGCWGNVDGGVIDDIALDMELIFNIIVLGFI